MSINIPIDEARFLRRECPHCLQEFKVQISPEDLKTLAEKGVESFLTEDEDIDTDENMRAFKILCQLTES